MPNAFTRSLSFISRSVDSALTSISGLHGESSWLLNTNSFKIGGFDSGVAVNEKTVQQIPAFVSGVRLLSESLGSLSIKLKRETQDNISIDKKHPAYYLICRKPNQYQTSQIFWETAMRFCILRGNHFAAIVRDGNGDPIELLPINEDKKVDVIEYNSRLFYRVSGIAEIIPSENMLHFKGLGNGVLGIGCVEYAMTSAGVTLASQKNQSKFYKGGSQLDGVLEHPKQLSKDAAMRLRNGWHETYHTNDPKARVAVLEEGMAYKPISVSPEAAKYLETLKNGYYDIAAILRVPPHMIALLDKSSFNNIEHQGLEFVKYTLLPWITRFEGECWDKLLTEKEKRADELKFKFNLEVLLRGDYKSRMEGHRVAVNMGVYSQNDVRKMEGQAPVKGGERYWMMTNMMPLDKVDEYLMKNQSTTQNQGNDGEGN